MKPLVKKSGSATVTIYHTPVKSKGKKYDAYTVRYYAEGKPCQAKRATLSDAETFADSVMDKINRGTAKLAAMDQAMMAKCLNAIRILAGRAEPDVAAQYFVDRHHSIVTEKTVTDSVAEMLKFKKQDNLSALWIENLGTRLKKFCGQFGGVKINALTGSQLDEWLRAVAPGARNRNNYRCALSTLFSFAKRRKYLPRDWHELESSPKTKETPGAIEIFTPEEMLKMLSTAPSINVKTLLVFGGFAGIRTSEVGRLDWSKVGPEFIEVMGRKGRTAARRLSPVLPALKSLSKPIREPQGHVNTILDMNHVPKQVEEASGVTWKRNGLRHSFISYRVAAIKNTAQVALECGTSEQKIFQNYRELVTERQAKEWFTIYKHVTNWKK